MHFVLAFLASFAVAGDTLTLTLSSPKTSLAMFNKPKLIALGTVTVQNRTLEVRCGGPSGTKTCSIVDTAGQEEIARTTNILLDDNGHVKPVFVNNKPAILGNATTLVIDLPIVVVN